MSHHCPTIVLNCIDFRFWEKLIAYLKDKGEDKFDYVGLAGGGKSIIDETTREAVFKQLDISTQKHGAERIYIVSHIDCGAYGGSAAFASPAEERDKLIADLQAAAKLAAARYPQLKTILLLNTWEGVEEISSRPA